MTIDRDMVVDICVLIPCYNNTAGLIRSIGSIVYDCSRYVVLIIDDGSTRPVTEKMLHEHIPLSVSIQIIRLSLNQGISNALNTGLDFIYANYKTQYIARLDCGDLCHPQRLYRQVSFLEKNPGIDLLGTWCYFKDPFTDTQYEYSTPTQQAEIERSMYFRNVFVHPTVMWRAETLNNFRYPYSYPHAEDYGLFYDIIRKKESAILDEFLVTCEINKKGISFSNRKEQLKSRLKVIRHYGQNKILVLAGSIKLNLLIAVPVQFVTAIKKMLYKNVQSRQAVFDNL